MAADVTSNSKSRSELKQLFRNGNLPSEKDYGVLVDSMINRIDDGFYKEEKNGFVVAPIGAGKRFFTLKRTMDDPGAFFTIEKEEGESPCLRWNPAAGEDADTQQKKSFYLHTNGNVGVGMPNTGKAAVAVDGFVASKGRIGNFRQGKVLADGQWHDILSELDNCQAFEIMARAGKKGTGRFSILHATALSAYGRSKGGMRKTRSYFGFFWNKLDIRWRRLKTHEYSLQLRTNSNYGEDAWIYYNITRLWDDKLFLDEEYYY